MPKERTSPLTILSAVVAIIALFTSIASLYLSFQSNSRSDRQDRLRIAGQVYLVEAPQWVYQKHPKSGNQRWFVIANHNTDPIDEVWVEGIKGTSVNIWQIPGCSLYALPDKFVPVRVDFLAVNGRWRRDFGSSSPTEDGTKMPSADTADSPWNEDIVGC